MAERRANGKSCRQVIARRNHALWSPAADRPDPVQTLVSANAGRLSDVLPIKWARMAASPFGFFRGAASVDGHGLWLITRSLGLTVQLCGDAHVRNLGAYAAPDGHLVFDLNDFDETLAAAPWEWDAKRLATSLILANREAGGQDLAGTVAVREFARCYREALRRFAAMHVLDLMTYEVHRYPKRQRRPRNPAKGGACHPSQEPGQADGAGSQGRAALSRSATSLDPRGG